MASSDFGADDPLRKWQHWRKYLLGAIAAGAIGSALLIIVGVVVLGRAPDKPAPSTASDVDALVQICKQGQTDPNLLGRLNNGRTYAAWLIAYGLDLNTCQLRTARAAVVTMPPLRPTALVYFRSCAVAWAAGKAPLYEGDPGYRSTLDTDHDGVACERKP